MLNYIRALLIMLWAHKGQKDKGGHLYWGHPWRVSCHVKGWRDKTIALLHDVIEDNPVLTLANFYFLDDEQRAALKLLTHDKSVTYFDYVQQIKMNKLAREVKLADLNDNMDLTRLGKITHKDEERYKKYAYCVEILKNVHQ